MNRAEKRRQQKQAKKATQKNIQPDVQPQIQQGIKLAMQHHGAGRLLQAKNIYQQILQTDPNHPVALHLLGVIAHQLENYDTAIDLISKAIAIKPDYAEAHYNLGNAHKEQGSLADAASSFQEATKVNPEFDQAHNNLGIALKELGKLEEAVASYLRATKIKPDYAEAHNNLGNTYKELGQLDAALASYRSAITINPDYAGAYSNLSIVYKNLGQFTEAKTAFKKGLQIKYGGPWWNAKKFNQDINDPDTEITNRVSTSPFKLLDNADQIDYLIAKGLLDPSFNKLADRYRAILGELNLRDAPDTLAKLNPEQVTTLGSFYDKLIHHADGHRVSSAINPDLEFEDIQDRYRASPISVITIDDIFTAEALEGLRNFCLESTFYFNPIGNHYVTSRIENGFNCDLLDQITEELTARFPKILGGLHLNGMWVYRYNNQSVGVAAHTDEGSVTFNIWVTPNEENLKKDHGGLIVYTKEQPYDWDWRHFNAKKHIPAVAKEINDFLEDADTMTIPHRENRAILFHSNLFHKSDLIDFKQGFKNRRMNVTLIFGTREG